MAVNVEYILSLRDRVSAAAVKMQGALSGVEVVANRVNTAMLAMGGVAIFAGLKKLATAADTQLKAETKVQQAIISTNGAAQQSFEDLAKYASELQSKTLFGDEDILNNATAQLLTFTNIAGENFKRTQALALDVATTTDRDLKSISISLGKALNDPVKNLSALSRSGIQFSESQTAVIKGLAETNRLAEAQSVILDELSRQYGGQAEAARRVGLGALYGGWNDISDAMEKVGEKIMPLFTKMGRWLTKLSGWITDNIDAIVSWGGFILRLSAIVAGVIVAFKTWTLAVNGFKLAMGALKVVMIAWRVVTNTATAAQLKLSAALWISPIGIIVGLVVALIAALVAAWHSFEGFRKAIYLTWGVLESFGKGTLSEFLSGLKAVLDGLSALGTSIAQVFKGNFNDAAMAAKNGLRMIGKGIMDATTAPITGGVQYAIDNWDSIEKVAAEKAKKGISLDLEALVTPKMGAVDTMNQYADLLPSNESEKLKSEGLTASGGVKQFIINIQNLTGIENLTTQTIAGGASQAGRTVRDELLTALADIKG